MEVWTIKCILPLNKDGREEMKAETMFDYIAIRTKIRFIMNSIKMYNNFVNNPILKN